MAERDELQLAYNAVCSALSHLRKVRREDTPLYDQLEAVRAQLAKEAF